MLNLMPAVLFTPQDFVIVYICIAIVILVMLWMVVKIFRDIRKIDMLSDVIESGDFNDYFFDDIYSLHKALSAYCGPHLTALQREDKLSGLVGKTVKTRGRVNDISPVTASKEVYMISFLYIKGSEVSTKLSALIDPNELDYFKRVRKDAIVDIECTLVIENHELLLKNAKPLPLVK